MASKKGKRGGHEAEHADERWLLTYADLITLLMALFMVMFSMAIVDQNKFDALKSSLSQAFEPTIMPGGKSIAQTGGQSQVQEIAPAAPAGHSQHLMSAREQADLAALERQVEAEADKLGLGNKVSAVPVERGLAIEILSDPALFESGEARLKPEGIALLHSLAPILTKRGGKGVEVEGHTDNVPITGRYPSNWELSTARASAVVRALIAMDLPASKLKAIGRAHLHPTATNATPEGRARNRRVDLVLPKTTG
jgi:chemotaxis protein MotB